MEDHEEYTDEVIIHLLHKILTIDGFDEQNCKSMNKGNYHKKSHTHSSEACSKDSEMHPPMPIVVCWRNPFGLNKEKNIKDLNFRIKTKNGITKRYYSSIFYPSLLSTNSSTLYFYKPTKPNKNTSKKY